MLRKKVKTKQKNKLGDILDAIGTSLLGNLLTGRGVKTKILNRWVIKEVDETIRKHQDFYCCLIHWLIFN